MPWTSQHDASASARLAYANVCIMPRPGRRAAHSTSDSRIGRSAPRDGSVRGNRPPLQGRDPLERSTSRALSSAGVSVAVGWSGLAARRG